MDGEQVGKDHGHVPAHHRQRVRPGEMDQLGQPGEEILRFFPGDLFERIGRPAANNIIGFLETGGYFSKQSWLFKDQLDHFICQAIRAQIAAREHFQQVVQGTSPGSKIRVGPNSSIRELDGFPNTSDVP